MTNNMAVSTEQWQAIALYTRSYILRTAENFGHRNAAARASARWTHSLNVLRNLDHILAGEGVPAPLQAICRVAALMHDIDHYTVDAAYHAQRGAETAGKFLLKQGFDDSFVQQVRQIIAGHHLDLVDDSPLEDLVQEIIATHSYPTRLVMDADTLDKVGATNGLQAIMTMVQNGAKIPDIARELAEGWPLQRASLWKQLLTTPTGKQLGVARFQFYETLATQIASEIVYEDPYPALTMTQEMRQIVVPTSPNMQGVQGRQGLQGLQA